MILFRDSFNILRLGYTLHTQTVVRVGGTMLCYNSYDYHNNNILSLVLVTGYSDLWCMVHGDRKVL